MGRIKYESIVCDVCNVVKVCNIELSCFWKMFWEIIRLKGIWENLNFLKGILNVVRYEFVLLSDMC